MSIIILYVLSGGPASFNASLSVIALVSTSRLVSGFGEELVELLSDIVELFEVVVLLLVYEMGVSSEVEDSFISVFFWVGVVLVLLPAVLLEEVSVAFA